MSSAASTIPAKRNVFRTKLNKINNIPSLEDKPKREHKAKKQHKRGKADVLVVKHKDTQRDGLEHAHFENEETWMGKTKNGWQLRPDKLGAEIRENVKHRKIGQLNLGDNLPGESNKPTIKIMNVEHYDNFIEERRQLLELNEKSEKRIKDLEQEVARIMGEFTKLYEDNEKLRRKMDTGKDPLLEPYSRVFEDRKILREAEHGYKSRIIRFEKEMLDKQRECEKLQDKVKTLQSKLKPTDKAEYKGKETTEKKLQAELRKIKAENETLKININDLEKMNNKPNILKIKYENDALRSIIKKLEFQLLQNGVIENKNHNQRKEDAKPKHRSKPHQVIFDDKPIVFDYEYLLPDSQVYH